MFNFKMIEENPRQIIIETPTHNPGYFICQKEIQEIKLW